ncbi:MAG TPA: nuclear transport factor 2 family protein [Gemmatimonadaceae bacterium]|nr:nuclear transport factor 2 family protein [Gemmatimonadaceae bacterium]
MEADSDRTDFDRIDELHQTDMRASQERDYLTLRSLLSDDFVMLPPGGELIRGRAAVDASFAKMGSVELPTDVLEYRFDWKEVRVLGDYAFEWGYIRGAERDRKTGEVSTSMHHVMRILQRQADGRWKVHRSIWNEAARPKAH